MSELTIKELQFYAQLSLDELDGYCAHKAARSSGPGGQSVNTTDSKVMTQFIPCSTIRATSQRERSQLLNRRANLQKIHKKLVILTTPVVKRVKTKPSKAAQARRLAHKTRRSTVKRFRQKDFDDE
jgi:ribosome-associated protein